MSENQTNHSAPQQEFAIQRIYLKDLSFESPNAPFIFKEQWNPDVNMELSSRSTKLEEGVYDIELGITTTVKKEDATAFLIEAKQAGIFTLKGFEEEQLDQMLNSFCLEILFPYVREVISEAAVKGGFPPLYLSPINFNMYYAEQRKHREKQKQTETSAANE